MERPEIELIKASREAASVAGCHVRDAQSARENLIRKVAARLGYI